MTPSRRARGTLEIVARRDATRRDARGAELENNINYSIYRARGFVARAERVVVVDAPIVPLPSSEREQISAHSNKQYSLDRKLSLNTIGSRRTLAGPNPGPPPPPRAHVARHLFAHFSTALPFGPDVSDFSDRLARASPSLARNPLGTSSM